MAEPAPPQVNSEDTNSAAAHPSASAGVTDQIFPVCTAITPSASGTTVNLTASLLSSTSTSTAPMTSSPDAAALSSTHLSASTSTTPDITATSSSTSSPSTTRPSTPTTSPQDLPACNGPKRARKLNPKERGKPGHKSSWPPQKLAFLKNPEGEVNEKAALSVPDSDAVEELTNEQKKAREEDNRACHQMFSNWFCARMKRLSVVADPAAALTEFLGMSSTDDWEALVDSGRSEGQKTPLVISAIMEAAAEAWAEESDKFKAELEAKREAEYLKAKEESSKVKDAPIEAASSEQTPEEYQHYIDCAAVLLESMVNAVFKKMGLITTVILAGPMPNCGGQIKLRALTHARTGVAVPPL
ncbi:uncharacterized protein STEHIDRAFT_160724 [Stereum hirsutum FP-91666 SS1]|uniref:uncharacterized protein n=1 Tax=Stereum hirsutum (strain FP-91666) TaxID=721885 RepID=UPI0004449E9F|nr:uncharacterized protein STEHIDRAFT_160724 [Stereum hirsutum FP-91666 SS1]EIM83121.1 hypothetical protein STEHIDRAFT_160724 [Stereum hirsutum FP-91666 SS1]